jgi:hypothetical protein
MYCANQSSMGCGRRWNSRVAVPSGRRALDPLQLLLGHRNVVVHRPDVTWVSEDVAADLVQQGRQGDEYLNAYVADLRATQAQFPRDPRVTKVIAALSAASAHFATWWNGHEIAAVHETHKTIEHPQVGLLRLDYDVLRVDGADLRVVPVTAAPGTPQADALGLLVSLDVTPVR